MIRVASSALLSTTAPLSPKIQFLYCFLSLVSGGHGEKMPINVNFSRESHGLVIKVLKVLSHKSLVIKWLPTHIQDIL